MCNLFIEIYLNVVYKGFRFCIIEIVSINVILIKIFIDVFLFNFIFKMILRFFEIEYIFNYSFIFIFNNNNYKKRVFLIKLLKDI